LYVVCLGAALTFAHSLEAAPRVALSQGNFNGQQFTSRKGRQFFAFNGIKYGVQKKRFQEAELPDDSTEVFNATKDGPDCLQINGMFDSYNLNPLEHPFIGEEDCLFLNVYTPNLNPKESLDVMVWIHGGAFFLGSGGRPMAGPESLMDQDVVLVSLNYRLGPFGFLSTGDEVLPGNYGLKDQNLALKWVRKNIRHFGGNPNSVTIFGQSAGGACVHLHTLSPRSAGLFHKAISQSGTGHSPWAWSPVKEAKEHALRLANHLDCPETSSELLTCLQSKTSQEIIAAYATMRLPYSVIFFEFRPVPENHPSAFLKEDALETKVTVPWISGVNTGEGTFTAATSLKLFTPGSKPDFKEINQNYKLIFPFSHFLNGNLGSALRRVEKIKQFYFKSAPFGPEVKREFVQMFSDGFFNYAHEKSKLYVDAPFYQYMFDHQSPFSFVGDKSFFNDLKLANHGDEIFRLFKIKAAQKVNVTTDDDEVSDVILKLWTNFAKTGNPNEEGKSEPWIPSKKGGNMFFEIGPNLQRMKEIDFSTIYKFWDDIRNTVKD